jgi:hypothetical protein
MIALQIEQTFVSNFSHPEVERHRPTFEVIVHTAKHLGLRFLNHIGTAESGPHFWIQAAVNKGSEFRPEANQELLHRFGIALRDLIEQRESPRRIAFYLSHQEKPPIGNPLLPATCDRVLAKIQLKDLQGDMRTARKFTVNMIYVAMAHVASESGERRSTRLFLSKSPPSIRNLLAKLLIQRI